MIIGLIKLHKAIAFEAGIHFVNGESSLNRLHNVISTNMGYWFTTIVSASFEIEAI